MVRRLMTVLAGTALLAGGADAATLQDAPPGASSCSGCHAAASSLETPIPSLTGRTAPEIAGIMREFKSDARPATVMGRIAKGLSDSEIDAIAEWFGSKKD
jgi:sulfide dehydrogenase cytochrome subunit